MRRTILASVSLLALSVGSQAADLGVPRMPVAVMAQSYNWTGAYAGALAGVGIGFNHWTDVNGWYNTAGQSYNSSPVGIALGLFAGYNWQVSPNFLVGVEADITYNTASGRAFVATEPAYVTARSNFAGSLRARAGVVVDRALFYVTGGLALGNPSQRWVEASGAAWKADGFRAGYVVGVGTEYMVSTQWTVRLEALYYDFGNRTATDVTPAGTTDFGNTTGYVMRARSSQVQIRAGAAYRF
ncbi:MAG: porin family protein [Rhizobiales bacterium]|nr:porin family protein [Hyphomicrobiales bacterium]